MRDIDRIGRLHATPLEHEIGIQRGISDQLVVGGERRKLDSNVWDRLLIGHKTAQSIEVRTQGYAPREP